MKDMKHIPTFLHIQHNQLANPGFAQDVEMTAEDSTKLHSWMMWPKGWSKQQRRSRPTILFFQARSQGYILD